jgi:SAM-dependent methyltransferase
MAIPFSKRNKPPPEVLRYDLPVNVRNRIAAVFSVACEDSPSRIALLLRDAAEQCRLQYGYLVPSTIPLVVANPDPADLAKYHFANCDDELAIDFIEFCLASEHYYGAQAGVDFINRVLREEGIGYQFSPYGPNEHGRDESLAVKTSNQLVHQDVVLPTLQLLTEPKFKDANREMLAAHQHVRHGEFGAAINASGQAFESALKVICAAKGWPFDPKRPLAGLVDVCRANNLFPAFYVEAFKSSGTIRNNLGSHGMATTGNAPPNAALAEHLIHLNSAHILLLTKLAAF